MPETIQKKIDAHQDKISLNAKNPELKDKHQQAENTLSKVDEIQEEIRRINLTPEQKRKHLSTIHELLEQAVDSKDFDSLSFKILREIVRFRRSHEKLKSLSIGDIKEKALEQIKKNIDNNSELSSSEKDFSKISIEFNFAVGSNDIEKLLNIKADILKKLLELNGDSLEVEKIRKSPSYKNIEAGYEQMLEVINNTWKNHKIFSLIDSANKFDDGITKNKADPAYISRKKSRIKIMGEIISGEAKSIQEAIDNLSPAEQRVLKLWESKIGGRYLFFRDSRASNDVVIHDGMFGRLSRDEKIHRTGFRDPERDIKNLNDLKIYTELAPAIYLKQAKQYELAADKLAGICGKEQYIQNLDEAVLEAWEDRVKEKVKAEISKHEDDHKEKWEELFHDYQTNLSFEKYLNNLIEVKVQQELNLEVSEAAINQAEKLKTASPIVKAAIAEFRSLAANETMHKRLKFIAINAPMIAISGGFSSIAKAGVKHFLLKKLAQKGASNLLVEQGLFNLVKEGVKFSAKEGGNALLKELVKRGALEVGAFSAQVLAFQTAMSSMELAGGHKEAFSGFGTKLVSTAGMFLSIGLGNKLWTGLGGRALGIGKAQRMLSRGASAGEVLQKGIYSVNGDMVRQTLNYFGQLGTEAASFCAFSLGEAVARGEIELKDITFEEFKKLLPENVVTILSLRLGGKFVKPVIRGIEGKAKEFAEKAQRIESEIRGVNSLAEKIQKIKEAIKANPELFEQNPNLRLALVEEILEKKLTSKEKEAILKSHKSSGEMDNLSFGEIRSKYEILKKAGFSKAEIRKLMDAGIVGKFVDIFFKKNKTLAKEKEHADQKNISFEKELINTLLPEIFKKGATLKIKDNKSSKESEEKVVESFSADKELVNYKINFTDGTSYKLPMNLVLDYLKSKIIVSDSLWNQSYIELSILKNKMQDIRNFEVNISSQNKEINSIEDAILRIRTIDPKTLKEYPKDLTPNQKKIKIREAIAYVRKTLPSQYRVIKNLVKNIRKYLIKHQDASYFELEKKFLTPKVQDKLSLYQIKKIQRSLLFATERVSAVNKYFPEFKKNPKKAIEKLFNLKAGSIQGKVEIIKGVGVIHFNLKNLKDYALVYGGENAGSSGGFALNRSSIPELLGAITVMKNIKGNWKKEVIWHEAKHQENILTFSEYYGKKNNLEKSEIFRAKDEIIAYFKDGNKAKSIGNHLTKDDGSYDYFKESKKKIREKLRADNSVLKELRKNPKRDIKELNRIINGLEKELSKLDQQWERHKKTVVRMINIADRVRTASGKIDLDLLAVTPWQHWKWLIPETVLKEIKQSEKNKQRKFRQSIEKNVKPARTFKGAKSMEGIFDILNLMSKVFEAKKIGTNNLSPEKYREIINELIISGDEMIFNRIPEHKGLRDTVKKIYKKDYTFENVKNSDQLLEIINNLYAIQGTTGKEIKIGNLSLGECINLYNQLLDSNKPNFDSCPSDRGFKHAIEKDWLSIQAQKNR